MGEKLGASHDPFEDTRHLENPEIADGYWLGDVSSAAVMDRLLGFLDYLSDKQRAALLAAPISDDLTFGQYLEGPAQQHGAESYVIGLLYSEPEPTGITAVRGYVDRLVEANPTLMEE